MKRPAVHAALPMSVRTKSQPPRSMETPQLDQSAAGIPRLPARTQVGDPDRVVTEVEEHSHSCAGWLLEKSGHALDALAQSTAQCCSCATFHDEASVLTHVDRGVNLVHRDHQTVQGAKPQRAQLLKGEPDMHRRGGTFALELVPGTGDVREDVSSKGFGIEAHPADGDR